MLTELDSRILRIYQSDPNIQMANLASKAGTTPAVLSRRLGRLRQNGQIVAKRQKLVQHQRCCLEDWAG